MPQKTPREANLFLCVLCGDVMTIKSTPDTSVTFTVRVVPRSSRSEIVGEMDGVVKVRLTSPPVDGAANSELIKLFAKKLGVARAAVEIVSGATAKTKRMRVTGVSAEQVRNLLA